MFLNNEAVFLIEKAMKLFHKESNVFILLYIYAFFFILTDEN